MKMLHRIIPSWAWLALVLANVLFFFGSLVMGIHEMAVLNVLSAGGCWVGYRLSKFEEDDSSKDRE